MNLNGWAKMRWCNRKKLEIVRQRLVKISSPQTKRQNEVVIQVLDNRCLEQILICNSSLQNSITAILLELKVWQIPMVEFKRLVKEPGICSRWVRFKTILRDQKTHSLENLRKTVKLSECTNNSRTKVDNTFSTDAILDFKIRKTELIQKQLFNNKLRLHTNFPLLIALIWAVIILVKLLATELMQSSKNAFTNHLVRKWPSNSMTEWNLWTFSAKNRLFERFVSWVGWITKAW